jgi:putative ATPase
VTSARELGLPEARIPLANAAVMLATAPKSNSSYEAYGRAAADIQAGRGQKIPDHLRDSHYEGSSKLGHGVGYQYPHAFENHYVPQQYLPDDLKNAVYYEFGENKTEQAAKQYAEKIGSLKKNRH